MSIFFIAWFSSLLAALLHIFSSPKLNIRKEACWLASNIAAGKPQQIEKLFENSDVMEGLIHAALDAQWCIRKEAIWTLANICTTGEESQVQKLVRGGGMEALAVALDRGQSDAKVLVVTLEAINRVLDISKAHELGYDLLLDEYDGVEKIESLQEHPNDDVYEHAIKMIEAHFAEDEGEDENVAPETTESDTFAFGMTSKQLFPPGSSPQFNFRSNEPRSPAHPIVFDSQLTARENFMSD